MSNLLNAYHPHHAIKNLTCKGLLSYINELYNQAELFGAFKKHDGVSIPVSLDIESKELGIKRNINKSPVLYKDLKYFFINKDSVLRGSKHVLKALHENIQTIKKINILKNPNRVLMFEYLEPEQNIILHKKCSIIYLGMFKISNGTILKLEVPEHIENTLLTELNKNSEIKFVKAKLCKLKKTSKTFNLFVDELKSIYSYKNLLFENSLYHYFNNDAIYEKSITDFNKKSFLTTGIGYYNKIKEINTEDKYGILATLIMKISGDILKKEIDNDNICEGYILYDFKQKKYIKFVGSYIEKRHNSFFQKKKHDLPPLMPFIG